MRRTFWLRVRGFLRLSVHQALANGALEQNFGAVGIGEAERRARVVAKIELGKVAVQVGFADAVERPVDATLEDGEHTLNSVAVDFAAYVLTGAVIDRQVLGELETDTRIDPRFVGHEAAFAAGVLDQDQTQRLAGDACDMERTDLAGAIHQGAYCRL